MKIIYFLFIALGYFLLLRRFIWCGEWGFNHLTTLLFYLFSIYLAKYKNDLVFRILHSKQIIMSVYLVKDFQYSVYSEIDVSSIEILIQVVAANILIFFTLWKLTINNLYFPFKFTYSFHLLRLFSKTLYVLNQTKLSLTNLRILFCFALGYFSEKIYLLWWMRTDQTTLLFQNWIVQIWADECLYGTETAYIKH